jgi:hypothetical protein
MTSMLEILGIAVSQIPPRASGHVQSITPSGLFNSAAEMYLSLDRIRFNAGEA